MQVKLPVNEKLERLVLAAAMQNNLAALEVLEKCESVDFMNKDNQNILQCVKDVFKKINSISLESLFFQISKQDNKNLISKEYVTDIALEYWCGMPYSEYILELKNISYLRRAIYAAQELMLEASKPDVSYETVISEHQNRIMNSHNDTKNIKSASEISKNFSSNRNFVDDMSWRSERFRNKLPVYEGISSGYQILDNTLGAFQNGYIYTIGARTSMGKTTFMLNLIRNMVQRHRVGVFSLEMGSSILYAKLACMQAKVRYRDYYDGNLSDYKKKMLTTCENHISKLPIFIDDDSNVTVNKLVSKAKRLKYSKEIEILFIDYLTRIKGSGRHSSKHLEVDEITKSIQALAKTLNIPIIVLAQLNRQTINASKTRPSMIDFKESGSIEEDSDACLLLHRPEYYDPKQSPGCMEVIVDKNRIMGTRKTIEFHCNSNENEVYNELRDISEEIRKANEVKESKVEKMSWAARLGDLDEDD